MTRTGLWANMNSRQQKVYIEVSFSSSSKHFFHGQNIGDPSSQMCRLQCSWWDPQPALTCESRGRGPKYDNSSPNEKKKKKPNSPICPYKQISPPISPLHGTTSHNPLVSTAISLPFRFRAFSIPREVALKPRWSVPIATSKMKFDMYSDDSETRTAEFKAED